eukprot:3330203-Rhodomonas_salina.2
MCAGDKNPTSAVFSALLNPRTPGYPGVPGYPGTRRDSTVHIESFRLGPSTNPGAGTHFSTANCDVFRGWYWHRTALFRLAGTEKQGRGKLFIRPKQFRSLRHKNRSLPGYCRSTGATPARRH